jgi:hypothetical protein
MQASDATVQAAPPATAGGASDTREIRIQRLLKAVVIFLALTLLAGLALVVGRVIYLASSTRMQASQDVSVASPTLAIRPEQTLGLPAGAQVRSVSLSGNRLAVHYEVGSASGIAILDLQTGRTVTNVSIEPNPAGH